MELIVAAGLLSVGLAFTAMAYFLYKAVQTIAMFKAARDPADLSRMQSAINPVKPEPAKPVEEQIMPDDFSPEALDNLRKKI